MIAERGANRQPNPMKTRGLALNGADSWVSGKGANHGHIARLTARFRRLAQQLRHLLLKLRKFRLHNFPHQRISDGRITVNEPVSERDDLLLVGHAACNLREESEGLTQGLADDLEVAFYGSPQHRIVLVIAQCLGAGEVMNVGDSAVDVPELCLQATRHTRIRAWTKISG